MQLTARCTEPWLDSRLTGILLIQSYPWCVHKSVYTEQIIRFVWKVWKRGRRGVNKQSQLHKVGETQILSTSEHFANQKGDLWWSMIHKSSTSSYFIRKPFTAIKGSSRDLLYGIISIGQSYYMWMCNGDPCTGIEETVLPLFTGPYIAWANLWGQFMTLFKRNNKWYAYR